MKFEFFGIKIEVTKQDIEELEQAKQILNKHGFRAVRQTKDKSNKIASMKKANEVRTNEVKQKIIKAMEILSHQDKKITAYMLSKESGVSQPTAKKYLTSIQA